MSKDLLLAIIANPESGSVEEYVSQLLFGGRFEETERISISKDGWSGLRLQGVAKDGRFEFPNTIYIVKSGDSLLVMTALWDTQIPDRPLVEAVWESFSLRFLLFPPPQAQVGLTSAVASSSGAQQLDSPELKAALEELFWAGVVVAGIPRESSFEEARTRLSDALFDSLFGFIEEYERIGIDYQLDWPYCLNATVAADAIMSLSDSSSPAEAAPSVNRAIEHIVGMEDDVELARRNGARIPSEESILLCTRILD